MNKSSQWTTPTHGVQHLGEHGDRRWATVEDYGSFATLLEWFQGCGFSPNKRVYPTASEARLAGEQWVEVAR